MIIFIDESGDPGLKIKEGSSQYLVISLIIFENFEETQRARYLIDEYRKKIRYPKFAEFKFNKTNRKVVVGLLRVINSANFRIRAIVCNKAEMTYRFKKSQTQLYKYLLGLLLKVPLQEDQKCIVYLDGIADREFKKTTITYLRRYIGRRISNFKTVNSKNETLIQLADIVVGSIARSYLKEKKDAKVYKKIILNKMEEELLLKRSDLEPILK